MCEAQLIVEFFECVVCARVENTWATIKAKQIIALMRTETFSIELLDGFFGFCQKCHYWS